MKTYLTFSNVLAIAGVFVFILSFFMKNSGKNYVAAGGAEAAAIFLGFIAFSITSIHAAIIGFIYASSNESPDSNIRILASAELAAPFLLILGWALYDQIDHFAYGSKVKRGLNYAVKNHDIDLIRKAVNRPDFESDLEPNTLETALANGMKSEALDILIGKTHSGTKILDEPSPSHEKFYIACLSGLIRGNRNELWPRYLNAFNSRDPDIDYDDRIFYAGKRFENTSILEFFLRNPDTRQWAIDKSIELKSTKYIDYLIKNGIQITYSKNPDLLDYVINNSERFYDKQFLIFFLESAYKYDAEKDNESEKLLLRVNDSDVLKWMIKNGASIFQTDDQGNTFLHKLITMKEVDIVFLRNTYEKYKESDYLYKTNRDGITIHMLLMEHHPYEISRWLFDDVRLDTVDNNNNHYMHYLFRTFIRTPPDYNSDYRINLMKKIIKEYKQKNRDINGRNISGVSPMQYTLLNSEDFSPFYELGFTLDIINPVTKEPVIVDAFKEYIDLQAESDKLSSTDYKLRHIQHHLGTLNEQQRSKAIQEMVEHLSRYTRHENHNENYYAEQLQRKLKDMEFQ